MQRDVSLQLHEAPSSAAPSSLPPTASIGRWQLIETRNEGPRTYGQSVLYRAPNYVMVFGGSTDQANFSNQIHVLNLGMYHELI